MYMYMNFVFLLWGSKFKYFGNLLLTASSWKIAITAIAYMQYHCRKIAKKYWQASQDNHAKTVVELVWHSVFCTALVV